MVHIALCQFLSLQENGCYLREAERARPVLGPTMDLVCLLHWLDLLGIAKLWQGSTRLENVPRRPKNSDTQVQYLEPVR